jgi:uncharacterized protein (TIGR03437 family)
MKLGLETFVLATLCAGSALAYPTGALPFYSGAPGDRTCAACHGNGTVNTGGGNVVVNFPASGYTAGQTHHMSITITDATALRWGFELSARSVASAGAKDLGALASSDGNTQVINSLTQAWITHTLAGTRPGTSGPTTFQFDWTAPPTGSGDVTFYVAANAANNNGTADQGDKIYTSSKQISEAVTAPAPAIRAADPVLQTFSGRGDVSSGTWIEVYGANFSATTRSWAGSDFNGANGPTALDGWGVKVNGKPAVIYYISPTQINANVPDDAATGLVSVQVTGPNGVISNISQANKLQVSPALQTHPLWKIGSTNYVVAVHPSSTPSSTIFVGRPGMISGVNFAMVKPGDTVLLYALGCGPAAGVTPGVTVSALNQLSLPHEVRIGGKTTALAYDGYAPQTIGLVQFNVVIPDLGPGEYPIELIVNGVSNNQGLTFIVGN